MTTTPTHIDPESLVARIMEELRVNPAAQQLLMQALLTREFLGMPLRLERIEAQLDAMLGHMDSLEEGQRNLEEGQRNLEEGQRNLEEGQRRIEGRVGRIEGRVGSLEEGQRRIEGRVGSLEEGQRRIEGRVGSLEEGQRRIEGRVGSLEEGQRDLQNTVRDIQDKVGGLIGDTLELKLPGRIIPLLSQKIRLRRAEIVRSSTTTMSSEIADTIADAVDAGVLEDWQEFRIGLTDIIIRAQRQSDRSAVWVAVEASSAIHLRDIERARQSADALAAVFRENTIALVAGYAIDPEESRQAEDTGVEVLIVAR